MPESIRPGQALVEGFELPVGSESVRLIRLIHTIDSPPGAQRCLRVPRCQALVLSASGSSGTCRTWSDPSRRLACGSTAFASASDIR